MQLFCVFFQRVIKEETFGIGEEWNPGFRNIRLGLWVLTAEKASLLLLRTGREAAKNQSLLCADWRRRRRPFFPPWGEEEQRDPLAPGSHGLLGEAPDNGVRWLSEESVFV